MKASRRQSKSRPPEGSSSTGLGSPARARREDNVGPIRIPNFDDNSLASVSRAELEAWATLTRSRSNNDKLSRNQRLSFLKRAPRTLDRATATVSSSSATRLRSGQKPGYNVKPIRTRPSSAKVARTVDTPFDELECFGPPDATSADRPDVARLVRAVHASRPDSKKRPASAGAVRSLLVSQEKNTCRATLAENISSRPRQSEQHRSSDVSIRHVKPIDYIVVGGGSDSVGGVSWMFCEVI